MRKSINNVLITLGRTLRYAVEVGVLEAAPRVKLLRVPPQKFDFLDFEEFERLLEATDTGQAGCGPLGGRVGDAELRAMILLAGEAGLRSGELRALASGDIDLHTAKLTVRSNEHRSEIDSLAPRHARRAREGGPAVTSELRRSGSDRNDVGAPTYASSPLKTAALQASVDTQNRPMMDT